MLEGSGYALFGCDLLIKITTNITATMAIINTATPTAAPIIIAPLIDPELLSLLPEDVDDYNTHNIIIRLQKIV